MMDETKNYYHTLGLTPEASDDDIRRAYIRLAREYHPDHNNNEGNVQMAELNHVFEVLSNPQKRNEYDTRFAPSKVYDFSKPKQSEPKTPVKIQRKYEISTRSFKSKYLKEGLAILLVAAMVYAMAYLIIKIVGLYADLPDWVYILIPR